MTPAKSVSPLMKKYGDKLNKAVQAHAEDQTDYGIINLPGGISNGIAKLTKCYFDQYKTGDNTGQFYFRAEGSVVTPEFVDTDTGPMKVKGLFTSIMHAVCDTKSQAGKVTTQEQHIADILNELRKLGVDTVGATGADLEALAEAAKDAAPYFKFSTTESKPDPKGKWGARVWQNWHGVQGLEGYSEETGYAPGSNDNTEQVPDTTSNQPTTEVSGEGSEPPTDDGTTATSEQPNEENNEGSNESNEVDLDILAKLCVEDTNDAIEAQKELKRLALEAGFPENEIDDASSWDAVVEMIRNPKEQGTEETQEEVTEEWSPKVGETGYKYKLLDAKGQLQKDKSKKEKKPVTVEVLKVDETKKTVDIKNLEDKTTVKNVPWEQLIRE